MLPYSYLFRAIARFAAQSPRAGGYLQQQPSLAALGIRIRHEAE